MESDMGGTMELHCPQCGNNGLTKLSLVYQEGLFQTQQSSRVRAAVIGGTGPDLVLGRGTARASHQSVLSSQLSPPAKWSYLKIGSWAVLVFLCVGWLILYVNTVRTNSTTVLSASVTLFALVAAAIFALLLILAWRHNHSSYQRQYAQWDRSFICQRCGAVTWQL
jgi:hypothetical protein